MRLKISQPPGLTSRVATRGAGRPIPRRSRRGKCYQMINDSKMWSWSSIEVGVHLYHFHTFQIFESRKLTNFYNIATNQEPSAPPSLKPREPRRPRTPPPVSSSPLKLSKSANLMKKTARSMIKTLLRTSTSTN